MGFIERIFGPRIDRAAAGRLWDAVVEAARQPVFYAGMGVPDTIDGRFDLIAAHASLVMIRLKAINTKASAALSQAFFDVMFTDFERSLRERGIGDLSVPRHMKRMFEAFNGRLHSFEDALAFSDDQRLKQVVARNLAADGTGDCDRLVRHIRDAAGALAGISDDEIMAGQVRLPVPEMDGVS